jgi:type IX secretion system PorP/SprF family membrane protein
MNFDYIIKRLFALMLLSASFFSQNANAQDIHFSQFYNSPLLLNPAQTGLICNYRAGLNYRSQWSSVGSPYKTFAAFFDVPVYFNKKRNTALGLGLVIFNDVAGDGKYGTLEIDPSIAFHMGLGADNPKRHKLSVGFQPSLRQHSLNVSNLTFATQFNGWTIDPTAPTLEKFDSKLNQLYIDAHTGIQYSAAPTDEINYWIGTGIFHLLSPVESLLDNPTALSKVPMRYNINAGSRFILNERMYVLAHALFMRQAKAKELNFGAELDIKTAAPKVDVPDFTFFFGGYYRWKDAFQVLVGGELQNLRVALAYDVNVSSLHTASNLRGGYELCMIYKAPCRIIPYNYKYQYTCPRF